MINLNMMMMITKFNPLSSFNNSLVINPGGSYYCNSRHLVRFVHYKRQNLFPVMKKTSVGPNPFNRTSLLNSSYNMNSIRNMAFIDTRGKVNLYKFYSSGPQNTHISNTKSKFLKKLLKMLIIFIIGFVSR
jgi:hypothetical protein